MLRAHTPLLACVLLPALAGASFAQGQPPAGPAALVAPLVPKVEAEVARGMKLFDIPGVAVGIVSADGLVYAKGFGTRAKDGKAPVDTRTVFQIGSTTKSFLATTMAIGVDRGEFRWDDRVQDLAPEFELADPWVTREMRMSDIIAQRSGLPPYVNDGLIALGYDAPALIRSLRFARPISSFRADFTYTNITHLLAGRITARLARQEDWNALVRKEILDPLGMTDTSSSAEALNAAPNHAAGYIYTPSGPIEVPVDPSFPYLVGPAGNLNSSLEDAARWLRLHIGDGVFEGKRLVSKENLAVTRTPRVAMNDTMAYATGWVVSMTPNGRIVWHNGGTVGYGAHIGFLPDKGLGVVVLSNLQNHGFPDAIATGIYNALLGNPATDQLAAAAERARAGYEAEAKRYAPRPDAAPPPDLARLAGTYDSEAMGEAEVTAADGHLVLSLARTGARLRLSPLDGPLFVANLVPEGRFEPVVRMTAGQPSGLMRFDAGAEGRIDRLTWLYDDAQSYPFLRK